MTYQPSVDSAFAAFRSRTDSSSPVSCLALDAAGVSKAADGGPELSASRSTAASVSIVTTFRSLGRVLPYVPNRSMHA